MPLDDNPARADGPAAVGEGNPDGPQLIVLDPAGEAKHEGLPATWRPFTADRRILWCRLPSDGALSQADDLLADGADGGRADIVASGPAAGEAVRLAVRYPAAVRAVLLVDPQGEPAEAGTSTSASSRRARATTPTGYLRRCRSGTRTWWPR